jgi:hypothetical protein
MDARGYAQLVEQYLPGVSTTQLNAAAESLDTAVAAGDATIDTAKAAYKTAFDGIKQDLRRAIIDAVPIRELRGLAGELSGDGPLELGANLGPLELTASSSVVQLRDPRDGSLISLGPTPPNTFVAKLDAGPLRGGGTLVRLQDGLSGILTANVGVAEVAALTSLRKVNGGPSFLAVLSAGFTPGLQLGFGFQVNRIGGVIGIERRLDPTVLARRLGDGSATAMLFPLDIGKNGRPVLAAAEDLFPPTPGTAVAGPTFRLAWLEVAGQGFASVDLGVLLELPGPRKVILVGVLKAGIDPVVRLRADFAGVVDFAQQRATVDATLVDSGALGIFKVYGDMAFATSWGPQPFTVLSLGGFYPGLRPEPAQIRPLNRLGMAPDVALPGLRMRAEGYLAATSNTLQLGGRLDIGVDAGIASVSGFIGVDALVQFTPFHFNAKLAAGLDVRFLGQTFCGVSFRGYIDGPGPVVLNGQLTVETFFKDFEFDKTFVIGESRPAPALPPASALEAIRSEVKPQQLRSTGGEDSLVTLVDIDRTGEHAVIPPLAGVEWVQHVAPLDTPIDRVAGSPLGSVQTVHASASQPNVTTTPVKDQFAPGSFITLTESEALNGPTYDLLPAGVAMGGQTLQGNGKPRDVDVTVLRKVRGEKKMSPEPDQGIFVFSSALLAMVASRDLPPVVASTQVAVTMTAQVWATTSGTTHESATQAMQHARLNGAGVALHAADLARPVSVGGG